MAKYNEINTMYHKFDMKSIALVQLMKIGVLTTRGSPLSLIKLSITPCTSVFPWN